jgi:hypothetical protein
MNEIIHRLQTYQPSNVKSYIKPIGTLDYECPSEIDFTELTRCTQYCFGSHKVTFYYTNENSNEYFSYVDRLLWLLQPNKPLVADILLTSAKKFYPKGKVFGPSNVNTGYSSDKVVVYRKEEWFKVFIHECFHFFHFEKVLFEPALTNRILELFPVDSEVNVYESYCEVWARTLNCCMISVCKRIPLETLLYHEKKYAVRHMVNVLKHMNLTYDKIQKPCHYKENTNVLAYVVITAILMHHNFITNHTTLELHKSEPYVQFIEQHFRSQSFLDEVHHITPRITTTMSFYDITKM